MNGSLFGNDNFAGMMPNSPGYNDFLNTASNMNGNNMNSGITPPISGGVNVNNSTNSYAQGVLQNNIGMSGYFFVSFPDSVDWRDKIFYGTLADAGNDYILIYNEDNNEYYLVWSIYLNYATFDRKPNTGN